MKRFIASASVLLACVCVVPVLADRPEAPSKDWSAVHDIARQMGDAMVAGDMDKLGQVYADDFKSVGMSGKVHTKDDILRDVQSGSHKLEWYKLGPGDVRVFGDVAVAYGSVAEKRTRNGQHDSGQYSWMDLL